MPPFLHRAQAWPTPAILSIVVAWLCLELFWLGKFSLIVVGDNISLIPYLLAFHDNAYPVGDWTPFPAGGTDLIATGYAPLIFHWLFSLLPSWLAFQLLAIGPVVAGVLGTYGLSRRQFGFDRHSAVFAGFIFGVFYSREQFYVAGLAAYLPLAILTLSYLLESNKSLWRWTALIAIGFLMAHTALISRLLPWPAVTFFVWFWFIERRRRVLDWGIIVLFSILIIASRYQDILALFAYAKLAAISEFRGGKDAADILHTAVSYFVEFFSAKGFLPLLLLLGFTGFSLSNRQPDSRRLLSGIAAFVLLLFMASLAKLVLVQFAPAYSGYNVLHLMQGFTLFIVLAGGMAFRDIKEARPEATTPSSLWLNIKGLIPIGVVLFALLQNGLQKYELTKAWVSWGNFYQNTQNPILKEQAARLKARGEPVRAMSFYMHGGLVNSYGIETIEGYHPLMSKRYQAFWSKMAEGWRNMPGWEEKYGKTELGSLTSILPLESRPESRLGDFVNLRLLSLANAGLIISRDKLTDPELRLISGPQRPWSSLSRNEKIITHIKANFDGRKPLYLYENPDVLPRAFSVDSLKTFDTDQEVLAALGESGLEALETTAFMNKSDLPIGAGKLQELEKRKVSISHYSNDKIVIELEPSEKPTILIVCNTFSPFWQASTKGRETLVFPVNHTFWGVIAEPDTAQVVFQYHAPYRW